jgi:hypothetical protein
MKNILDNRDTSETRHKISTNFSFDQIIKQKIFEIEKINQRRPKTGKRGLKDNVTINKYQISKMMYNKNFMF